MHGHRRTRSALLRAARPGFALACHDSLTSSEGLGGSVNQRLAPGLQATVSGSSSHLRGPRSARPLYRIDVGGLRLLRAWDRPFCRSRSPAATLPAPLPSSLRYPPGSETSELRCQRRVLQEGASVLPTPRAWASVLDTFPH